MPFIDGSGWFFCPYSPILTKIQHTCHINHKKWLAFLLMYHAFPNLCAFSFVDASAWNKCPIAAPSSQFVIRQNFQTSLKPQILQIWALSMWPLCFVLWTSEFSLFSFKYCILLEQETPSYSLQYMFLAHNKWSVVCCNVLSRSVMSSSLWPYGP